ncbi:MAG: hypothetical protein IJU33_02980 [Bacteroidales bacterium]|nr:hypothetical protein [Bacteroidales bacterium]
MSNKIKRGHLDGYLTGDLFMFLFALALAKGNGIRILSAMGNLVYFVGGGRKRKLPEPSWKKLFLAHLN